MRVVWGDVFVVHVVLNRLGAMQVQHGKGVEANELLGRMGGNLVMGG